MVPAIILTLAGLAAGSLAMWPMFGPASAKISAAVLGVALAVYLWVHAGVRDHVRLAAVVVAAIVGDAVMMFVGVIGLLLMLMASNGSTPTPFVATAAAGAVGAAVIAAVFLLVLPSKGDHLLLEVVFCATVGASSVLLWEWFAALTAAGPIAQVPLWHVAVASSLAVVASLRLRPVAADRFVLRCLAGVGVAGVCALLLASGGAERAAAAISRPVVLVSSSSPYVDAIRAATIKSLKDAPPSIDLRRIALSAEEMFARPMAGIGCYPPLTQSIPPATKQVELPRLIPHTKPVETLPLQLPARHTYSLQCYRLEKGLNGNGVNVLIVQYPNDAWAQYNLRHQRGYDRLFDQRSVGRTTNHGRPIFIINETTYWVSGDKILSINGSVPRETVSAFVDTYLRRYPNSLDPDFDLPYRPRME